MARGLLLLVALWLVGCSDADNPDRLCQDNPALCQATGNGICAAEEHKLVQARWRVSQDGLDHSRYLQLTALDGLLGCIQNSGAFQIGFNKSKTGLGKDEVLNLLAQEHRQLLKDTRMTEDPWLLTYRWLTRRDGYARQRLLAQLDQLSKQNPELPLSLASHFRNRNPQRAAELLQPLLVQRQADPITLQALTLLASIRMEQQEWQQAYLWSAIAAALGEERVNLNRVAREGALSDAARYNIEQQIPDKVASLRQGTFVM